MRRLLLSCALPLVCAAPASADLLNAGDTLCVDFVCTAPFSNTPDVLMLSFGLTQVNAAFTTRHAALYDGTTLLGVHSDSLFGSHVGALNLNPTNVFKSSSSVFTFLNPAVVDFSSIQSGSIQGHIEFTIQTGQMDIDLTQVYLSLQHATGGSSGIVTTPAPTVTAIGITIGGGCVGAAPGAAYCFGDGSAAACPCGNAGGIGEGCANSTGAGAVLAASGSASVVADDLAFTATQLVPGQPGLLFAGDNAVNGGQGVIFGDGLRCAGGGVLRLGVRVANASGQSQWGPGLGAGAGFPWSPGDTRRFQGWYRDPAGSPCGSAFNLTNGYEVLFQ